MRARWERLNFRLRVWRRHPDPLVEGPRKRERAAIVEYVANLSTVLAFPVSVLALAISAWALVAKP